MQNLSTTVWPPGSNHPIRDKILDKVYMTSQNHGYAIDAETIPSDVEITYINLNDQTVSEFDV